MIVALGHVALFLVVYWLPGRLLLARLVDDPEPGEAFPAAVALGIVAVSTLALLVTGLIGLTTMVHLGPAGVIAAAVTVAGVAAGALGRTGLRRLWAGARAPSRVQVALAALTVGSTGFYLVHADRDIFWEEACMVRAAMAVRADTLREDLIALYDGDEPLSQYQSDPLKGKDREHNTFLRYNQGQRFGPTLLLAPLVALFDAFAFPLAFALQGLLLPCLGFALGRRFLPRPWHAWAVALALVFSPYGLATRTFDENLLSAPFGALALVLLLRRKPAPLAAGAVFSLFLGFREIGLLSLPFVALYLWKHHPTPRKAMGAFALGVVGFGLPTILMHILFVATEGGTWPVQAFERPLVAHDLFGWRFELPLLLSWPFWPEPLRSPFTAYPTLLAYPLDFTRRLGVIAMALLPAGVLWLRGRDRGAAGLAIAWFVAPLSVLLVQSNWIEPNKMGIPGALFAPIALFLGAGLAWLGDASRSWPRRALVPIVGLALPLAMVPLLRQVDAPVDERVLTSPLTLYAKIFPAGSTRQDDEVPEDVALERRRQSLSLLPRLLPDDFHPAMWTGGAQALLGEATTRGFLGYRRAPLDVLQSVFLGSGLMIGPVSLYQATVLHPDEPPHLVPWRFFAGPPPPEEERALVVLDLSRPPFGEVPPLRVVAARPDDRPLLDLTGSTVYAAGGIAVPYSAHARSLTAARSPSGSVHLYVATGSHGHFVPTGPLDLRRYDWGPWSDGIIPLLVPRHELIRLIDVRSVRPARWISRTIYIDEEGAWISDATPLSPT